MKTATRSHSEADFYRQDIPKMLRPSRPAPLATLLWALGILTCGTLLGIASAYLVIERDRPLQTVRIGAWEMDPTAGTEEADPYSIAIHSRGASVPLASGEGQALIARTDSSGRLLDPSCTYILSGETPAARLWTLTSTDRRGRLAETIAGRTHLSSRALLRRQDGSFEITASPRPASGNWLPLASRPQDMDGLMFKLRLYDAPVTTGAALSNAAMPVISRRSCP
ncbi:membrane protein [Roseibium aquae]|uniref:Membrane protein n=1 Tax=Roseibium aquae TaxID=1323746 RepID=A0A916TKN0_9HYPH|nr:DUF1214 domain-containing protein [Roseibium aquae]GGB50743.1 membrane protein [Roseibium aquae]